MLYHLVWIGNDLTLFRGLYSLFWIAMGIWPYTRSHAILAPTLSVSKTGLSAPALNPHGPVMKRSGITVPDHDIEEMVTNPKVPISSKAKAFTLIR